MLLYVQRLANKPSPVCKFVNIVITMAAKELHDIGYYYTILVDLNLINYLAEEAVNPEQLRASTKFIFVTFSKRSFIFNSEKNLFTPPGSVGLSSLLLSKL